MAQVGSEGEGGSGMPHRDDAPPCELLYTFGIKNAPLGGQPTAARLLNGSMLCKKRPRRHAPLVKKECVGNRGGLVMSTLDDESCALAVRNLHELATLAP